MNSHQGPWEHVSLPNSGSLGSLFASQGSWEYLRQVSLGPPLFPGKLSPKLPGRDVSGPPSPAPHLSGGSVPALQHLEGG